MATAKSRAGKAKELVIPPQKSVRTKVTVGGEIVVVHRFAQKARQQMLDTQQGKARNKKEKRDPEAEFEGAKYLNSRGKDCLRADAFKHAMVDAASFVDGVTKVHIRGAVFVHAKDRGVAGEPLIPFKYRECNMREDVVRLGNGSADLRYRPEYLDWECELDIEFDPDVISAEQVAHLVQRAGYAIGVHEGRPQKNGEWGRFDIKGVGKSSAKRATRTTRTRTQKAA